ncbi:hypothetical protein H0H93_014269 [Arthromyces matolae]|nr:hypothetical protein H0H93_014269 [Arthromyces matolae]
MQIKNCLTAFVVTACAAVGIKGNPTQFSRRSGLTDSVYINGEWSKMTARPGLRPEEGWSTCVVSCLVVVPPSVIYQRFRSATLDGAAGDVDSACLNTNATVSHVFFQSPSIRECEVSLEKGTYLPQFPFMRNVNFRIVATGYFDTMDTLCGIPPCPNDYAWDYRSKMCISCQTGVAPPKVAGGDTQLRREILAEASERYEADTLQKRVNCPTLGAFNIPGQRVILRLRNRVEAWTVGQEEGPTAAQLVANPNVQAAFQVACVR